MRIRIELGYEGTGFSGWARQPGLRTVQGEVEEALARIIRRPVPTIVGGRTDAGVHAREQVIHIDLEPGEWERLPGHSGRPEGLALVQRLTGALSFEGTRDVIVHRAELAHPGFHARFSALWRRYSYRIAGPDAFLDPVRRRDTLRIKRAADPAAMNEAAAELLGLHDFLPYCKPRERATTVRELQRLDLVPDADGVLVATVAADAFCRHMVRALMASLIEVGVGRRPVAWPAELLATGVRNSRLVLAPARGLTLDTIAYPADTELAARAELTRARRQADGAATL